MITLNGKGLYTCLPLPLDQKLVEGRRSYFSLYSQYLAHDCCWINDCLINHHGCGYVSVGFWIKQDVIYLTDISEFVSLYVFNINFFPYFNNFILFKNLNLWPIWKLVCCTKQNRVIILFLFFFLINLFILFVAALGLRHCAEAFSSYGERELLFVAVHGLLTAVASLVAEHRHYVHRLQ